MQNLNVCVIGAGALGTKHTAAWQEVADVEVVAVCDTDEQRARTAQENYDIAAAYSDYHAALGQTNLDEAVNTMAAWPEWSTTTVATRSGRNEVSIANCRMPHHA